MEFKVMEISQRAAVRLSSGGSRHYGNFTRSGLEKAVRENGGHSLRWRNEFELEAHYDTIDLDDLRRPITEVLVYELTPVD